MLNSFKIWPILFLITFPLCYSFLFYALPKISSLSNPWYSMIPLTFMFISIEYATMPIRHNAETFFNKHGLERSVHDYGFLQTLLLILITLTIGFNAITRIWFMANLDWENYFLSPEYYFNSITTGLGIMVLSTSVRLGSTFLKKKFKYHLAKICFQICGEKSDDTQQVKFLRLGVNYYNQFIKRTSSLKIQNTGVIYSKFISYNKTEKKTKIKSIIKSFEKESVLEPFKQLKKSFEIQDESVTESRLINDLKQWAPIIFGITLGIITNWDEITKIINQFFGLIHP